MVGPLDDAFQAESDQDAARDREEMKEEVLH